MNCTPKIGHNFWGAVQSSLFFVGPKFIRSVLEIDNGVRFRLVLNTIFYKSDLSIFGNIDVGIQVV